MVALTERYASKIRGILSCFDRVVITGTLPDICYADAMSSHLRSKGIRIFDYTRFAEPLRDEIRLRAEELAQKSGLEIEFIRKKDFRKENRIKKIIEKRGEHPGLVHIFSALEPCPSFKPWHDKNSGRTFLRGTEAKCIHYYFYFILEDLGLCYLRVPTWAPFRLQFYFNGHHHLAGLLHQPAAQRGVAVGVDLLVGDPLAGEQHLGPHAVGAVPLRVDPHLRHGRSVAGSGARANPEPPGRLPGAGVPG